MPTSGIPRRGRPRSETHSPKPAAAQPSRISSAAHSTFAATSRTDWYQKSTAAARRAPGTEVRTRYGRSSSSIGAEDAPARSALDTGRRDAGREVPLEEDVQHE